MSNVSGLSSWVSHYLNSKNSTDDTTAPVDSDSNAGVSNVDQHSGESAGQEATGSKRDLNALRGPLPILVFTVLALGGIGTVLARTSKSLSHKKHER